MMPVEWSLRTDGYLFCCDEGCCFWRVDRFAGLQPRLIGGACFGDLPSVAGYKGSVLRRRRRFVERVSQPPKLSAALTRGWRLQIAPDRVDCRYGRRLA